MMKTKSKCSIVVAMLMMIGTAMFGFANGNPRRSAQESNAEVVLRLVALRSTVCSGSSVDLEIELRNMSKRALSLLPDGIGSIHFRTTRTAANQPFPEFAYSDTRFDPFPHEKPSNVIALQPGESYRFVTSLPLKGEFFKSDGFYKVKIDYDGTLHQSTAQSGAPAQFKGDVESNWLIFEIEECDTTGGKTRARVPENAKPRH